MHAVQFVTNVFDEAVVLPCWGTLVLGLAALGWRRGALAWLLVVGGTMATVLLLKIGFALQGGVGSLYSPSGHTAMAATLTGGAWSLSRVRHRLAAAGLTAVAAAGLIGCTRVLLGDHSLADVMFAAPVGVAGGLLVVLAAARPPPGQRTAPAALATLAVGGLMHGSHLTAEWLIAAVLNTDTVHIRVPGGLNKP